MVELTIVPGTHDDVIMSYLIGLYAIYYGKNINRFVKVTSDSVGLTEKKIEDRSKVITALNARPIDMKQFPVTNHIIKKNRKVYEELAKKEIPVYNPYNQSPIGGTQISTDKAPVKKKISKNLINTLSAFNKR